MPTSGRWGAKGKILATDSTRDGFALTVLLTENKQHYPYLNTSWQEAASHYAKSHVLSALTAGLGEAQRALVSVGVIAVSPVKPLNVLVKNQSAKGLSVHMLVKGVAFLAPPGDGDGSVPAQPIPLRANILDGGLSPDGTVPTTSVGRIKIRFPGGGGA